MSFDEHLEIFKEGVVGSANIGYTGTPGRLEIYQDISGPTDSCPLLVGSH